MEHITEKRLALFKSVIAKTQFDLTILLENVHDPHNIGAVIRSCDAVGVRKIYVLDTSPKLIGRELSAFSTSTGVAKWIEVVKYTNLEDCVKDIKQNYDKLYCTHLSSQAKSVHDVDLTSSSAIVFGNEHDGVSDELLSHCDANIVIPQFGMVQSLNISVACAVTLFEISRQRAMAKQYSDVFDPSNEQQTALLNRYVDLQLLRNKPEEE